MICTVCSKEVDEGKKFCRYCGAAVDNGDNNKPTKDRTEKGRGKLILLVAIIYVVIIIVVFCCFYVLARGWGAVPFINKLEFLPFIN